MKTITCFVLIAAALVLPSCSTFDNLRIEKRHYGKGFYVSVNDRHADGQAPVTTDAPGATTPAENDAAVKENNAPAEQNSPQSEVAATSSPASSSTAEENNSPDNSSPADVKVVEKEDAFAPVKKMKEVTRQAAEKVVAQHEEEDMLVLVLLVILAIILPPLAVLLKDGLGVHFLLNLLFWLLGFGFILIIPGGYIYLGIFGLIAIVHALLVVLEVI